MPAKTFAQLYVELKGWLDPLPLQLAKTFINRAWISIQDSHDWSFLQNGIGTLLSTQVITAGSVNVTQFSSLVQFNATAQAALAGLSNPTIYKRQIRFAGTGGIAGSSIYSIIKYSVADGLAAGQAQLDRLVAETTNATQSYQMYRVYFGLPIGATGIEVTDMRFYVSIYCPSMTYPFESVGRPISELNARDPGRADFNANPKHAYFFGSDSAGNPLYELWPHIAAQQLFLVTYQRAGVDPAPTDILPNVIQEEALIYKALSFVYEWAGGQVALKGINWDAKKSKIMEPRGLYDTAFQKSQRNDQGIGVKSIIVSKRALAASAIGDDIRTGYFQIDPITGHSS